MSCLGYMGPFHGRHLAATEMRCFTDKGTCRKAQVGDVSLEVGALVVMPAEEDAEQPALGLLQAMWKPSSGAAEMQVGIPTPTCMLFTSVWSVKRCL